MGIEKHEMELKAKELFEELNTFMLEGLKASGIEIGSIFEDADDETLGMYRTISKVYSESKEYALMQARLFDNLIENQKKLLEQQELLLKRLGD